jgi:hypothetical protein
LIGSNDQVVRNARHLEVAGELGGGVDALGRWRQHLDDNDGVCDFE